MRLTFCELRERDVINMCDGKRLGCVCDLEIDSDCGKITAIFVCDKYFSIGGGKNQIRIAWDMIRCIGEDTVLVDAGRDFDCGEKPKCERKKRGWLFNV